MMAMTISANKLKLKIIKRKPDHSPCEVVTLPLSKDADGSGKTGLGILKQCGLNASHLRETIANGDRNRKQVNSILGMKRGPEKIIDLQSKKKLKMDRSMNRKCSVILKKLLTYQCSWPFLQPVDPVALKIPDYFSIISKPMDLGTVRSKLENGVYSVVEEFEADVRLTFSNAMLYNPPGNSIHQMAKKLDASFSDQWRLAGSSKDIQHISNDGEKNLHNVENSSLRIVSSCSETLSRKSVVLLQKVDGKGSKEVSTKMVPVEDINVIEKHSIRISKASKLSSSQPVSLCAKSSVRVESDSANSIVVNSMHKGSSQSTGRMKPKQMKEALAVEEKVPLTNTRVPVETMDEMVKCKPQMSRSGHDSDGAVSCLDEEHAYATETSVCTATASEEEWRSPICEPPLSPDKALRAAKLKQRFAETILKAQQKTNLHPGDKFDPVKIDEEKKRLERRQLEVKLKIEAQIKATQDREESERRMQREREREVARKSLEKMERSVIFDDSISTLTELAHIIGDFSFAGPLRGYGGMYAASNQFVKGKLKNPLERLGLFLKEDGHLLDEDNGHGREETQLKDCEEGELIL